MNDTDELVLAEALGRPVGATGWIRTNCPLCLDRFGLPDKRQSLGVAATTGYWHCWRCGQKGRVDLGSAAIEAPPEKVAPTEIQLPDDFIPLYEEPGRSASVLAPARRYLRGRGIDEAVWRSAAMGACLDGYLRNRIVVPIWSADGEKTLGWVARDWTGSAMLRYLYPRGMARAQILFGEAALYRIVKVPVLVVEGIFDVLPYWGDAVALLGKPSGDQVGLLCRAKRPVVVALDGDSWEEGWALSRRLNLAGIEAHHIQLPPGEDPGSVEPLWLRETAQQIVEGT